MQLQEPHLKPLEFTITLIVVTSPSGKNKRGKLPEAVLCPVSLQAGGKYTYHRPHLVLFRVFLPGKTCVWREMISFFQREKLSGEERTGRRARGKYRQLANYAHVRRVGM